KGDGLVVLVAEVQVERKLRADLLRDPGFGPAPLLLRLVVLRHEPPTAGLLRSCRQRQRNHGRQCKHWREGEQHVPHAASHYLPPLGGGAGAAPGAGIFGVPGSTTFDPSAPRPALAAVGTCSELAGFVPSFCTGKSDSRALLSRFIVLSRPYFPS